jgi:hypothetical protein
MTQGPRTIGGMNNRGECDPLFTSESRISAIAKSILTLTGVGRNSVAGHSGRCREEKEAAICRELGIVLQIARGLKSSTVARAAWRSRTSTRNRNRAI